MGVATRGVKFKFTAGEKVLCYEPDPTKAKVLYESKVLDLVVNRDERGRKIPEYRIHFYGWNSSWDRFVREEFILPYTEANRELQTKLAEDAALTIKGRRKFKLPPLIKETLNKKQCMEAAKEKAAQPEKPDSSSSASESEDEIEREVHIKLPDSLRNQLDLDYDLITKQNKWVKLPCEPHVVSILEGYVKYLAAKLLCAFPPRNSNNGKQMMPDDVKNKISLCKETMDGIRVYFDFTLPYLLLYRQEIKQLQQLTFDADSDVRVPLSTAIREQEERLVLVKVKEEEIEVDEKGPSPPPPRPTNPPVRPRGRPPRRGRPCLKNKVGRRPYKTKNGSTAIRAKLMRARKRTTKGLRWTGSTRVLRSSDKPKEEPPKKEPPDIKPSTSSSTEPPAGPVPMETRLCTRKSLPSSPIPGSPPPVTASSNSSSHSTRSESKVDRHRYRVMNNAALLEDVLGWSMLPGQRDGQRDAPSLVYGAQHLLRLFVRFPGLISKMHMSSRKLPLLLEILEEFLFYLSEKREEFFSPSVYVDRWDVNSTNVAEKSAT